MWNNRTLIEAAKARFEQTDNHAHVIVVDDVGILEALIDAEHPEEQHTIESRIRCRISLIPPGALFTVRTKLQKGLVAINILERSGITKKKFDKLKERNERFKRYMDAMKTKPDGYYLTPMQ